MNNHVKIHWKYEGKTDIATGTGSYLEEKIIGYAGGIILSLLLIIQLRLGRLQWNLIQIVVGLLHLI